jgi:hypothetical protein
MRSPLKGVIKIFWEKIIMGICFGRGINAAAASTYESYQMEPALNEQQQAQAATSLSTTSSPNAAGEPPLHLPRPRAISIVEANLTAPYRATLPHLQIPGGADAAYDTFERKYQRLYHDPSGVLACVDKKQTLNFSNVVDVDMGELRVIEGKGAIIGTKGLAPCVAICARGKNNKGEPVLGIYHYSGQNLSEEQETPQSALDRVISEVCKKSVIAPEIWLVGGTKTAAPVDEDDDVTAMSGTLKRSEDFVENYQQRNIKGIRLNVSEYYEVTTQTGPNMWLSKVKQNGVEVVMTPERVFYSRETMY